MYTGLIFTSAFITYISVNDESTDPYSIRVLSGWPFFSIGVQALKYSPDEK